MSAGIAAQYGFLYQRYAFLKLALENAGMDRFFVYEGADDVDISEENRISAVRGYNKQFVQVKSGTVSRDCWAKVIGNWLMIEDEIPSYRIILENALSFDFKADDVVSGVLDYFVSGSGKAPTSIANKVYKRFLEGKEEAVLKEHITGMLDQIFFDVFSMEQLSTSIKEIFQSVYCPDIKKYEMAKICRCERFVECVNAEIDEALKKKKSFTLRYVGFMRIINKITAEISDGKYVVDIAEMRKRKKTEAERLINSGTLREVRQLRLVNSNNGFIVKELVKELLYRDLREVYTAAGSTLISNIEETAYSNYEDVLYSLSENEEPRKLFDATVDKDIPLNIVDNSPLYRNGCYVYLTGEEADEGRRITWGEEHE